MGAFMTVKESRFSIFGVLEQVPLACEFVVEAAQNAGLDERAVYHCQLAVDEACTNIIEHGLGLQGGDHRIEIICRADSQQFVITILDDSPAFNPLNRPNPDPTAPLEDREMGGWGIYFIKKLMDDVIYQRENNSNRLTMIKNLDPSMTP